MRMILLIPWHDSVSNMKLSTLSFNVMVLLLGRLLIINSSFWIELDQIKMCLYFSSTQQMTWCFSSGGMSKDTYISAFGMCSISNRLFRTIWILMGTNCGHPIRWCICGHHQRKLWIIMSHHFGGQRILAEWKAVGHALVHLQKLYRCSNLFNGWIKVDKLGVKFAKYIIQQQKERSSWTLWGGGASSMPASFCEIACNPVAGRTVYKR